MRAITPAQIGVFLLMLVLIIILAATTALATVGQLPLGEYRGVVVALSVGLLTFGYGIGVHRIALWLLPLPEGIKREGTKEEFAYHLYILFYLMLFFPVILSGVLPLPWMRIIYKALGSKIGKGSYGSTQLVDPPLIEIGEYCVLGQAAIISGHHMVAGKITHKKVKIGNRVTIGAGSMIGAGVTIEDGAVIGTGSVINPFCTIGEGAIIAPLSYLKARTRVGPGETWMGIPAHRQEKTDQAE